MDTLKQRYQKVKQQIHELSTQFDRAHEVQLLAVSKRHSAGNIRELYELGQKCFGENYLQEAIEKIAELNQYDIEWHFIGPIQSNKTKPISQNFQWVHSVDRLKIAQRLNQHLLEIDKTINICLQVNINNEEQKSGFSEEILFQDLPTMLELEQLNIRGLMAIPERSDDKNIQTENFALLKQLQEKLNQEFDINLDTLSMGMSGDMDSAIKEGSTIIRIGTAIFGPRDS